MITWLRSAGVSGVAAKPVAATSVNKTDAKPNVRKVFRILWFLSVRYSERCRAVPRCVSSRINAPFNSCGRLGTPGFGITRCAPPRPATHLLPRRARLRWPPNPTAAPLEGQIRYEGMPRGALLQAAARRSELHAARRRPAAGLLAGDAAVAEHGAFEGLVGGFLKRTFANRVLHRRFLREYRFTNL